MADTPSSQARAAGSEQPASGSKVAASGGGGGAEKISRADLILLVQKLQKRTAAGEQLVAKLRKEIAEKEEEAEAERAKAAAAAATPTHGTTSTNLIDLLTPTPIASSDEPALLDWQAQLAKQTTTHASQLANLQADLRAKAETIESLTRAAADSKKASLDAETWKKRFHTAAEEVKRLQQQVATAANNATANASPVSPQSPASGTSNGGGSFLLENANKELRAALAAEQAKSAAAEKRAASLQQQVESARADSSAASQTAVESLQKRVGELETKLATSDSKLVKSFQLVTEEKKVSTAAAEALKTSQAKVRELTSALSASQDLLREHAAQLDASRAEADALRQANLALSTRVESASLDEARELRKSLASKDEHVLALQNELDHTRSVHARTIAHLESDSALQTQQLERALEEERRDVERITREGAEAAAYAENERSSAQQRLHEVEEHSAALTREHADAIAAQTQLTDELTTVRQELEELRTAHQTAVAQHAGALESVQSSSSAKYTRLLHELKQYKIHAITSTSALQNEVDQLRATNAALDDELRHGKPSERRIWELATLQSSRDESLRQSERECAELRALAVELRGQIESSRAEASFLSQELRTAKASSSRAQVDFDYLKSVLVQFLAAEEDAPKRRALRPVLAQLLCFTDEDRLASQPERSQEATGFWGRITALGGTMAGAPPAPKRITLPPSVPIGVNTADHPSPFVQTPTQTTTRAPPTTQTAATRGHDALDSVDLTGGVEVAGSPR